MYEAVSSKQVLSKPVVETTMTEDDVPSFVFFPHGAEQVGSIPARTTRIPKNQPPGPDTGFRPGFFLAPVPGSRTANRERPVGE